jgi:hypothetical protein
MSSFVHIGPISSKLSKEHIFVVPSVAQTFIKIKTLVAF